MSAFVVEKVHIDALLTAGLKFRRGGRPPLRWYWPEVGPEDREAAYQRGEPWGPAAVRLYKERRRELTAETAGRVGAMLSAENVRSVNHRYDEDDWEEPYEFEEVPGVPDPVVILKAISCYEYQSCEHPEWPTSEAHAFCEALRSFAIARLPGYDDALGWEINDREVFRRSAPGRNAGDKRS